MSNVSLWNVLYGNCMCEVLPSWPALPPPSLCHALSRSFVGGVRDLHLAVEILFRAAAALLFSCNAEKAQLNLF